MHGLVAFQENSMYKTGTRLYLPVTFLEFSSVLAKKKMFRGKMAILLHKQFL